MDPREFLTTLWGDPPPGKILVWMLPEKNSYWHLDFGQINEDMEEHRHHDVYTGVGLATPDTPNLTSRTRIPAERIAGIAGLWADIDVAHAVHKKPNLPPTMQRALETLTGLPFPPTMLINSGHGLQVWWLFNKPWMFLNEDEHDLAQRLSQWWHTEVNALYRVEGWTTDSVHDLSRVMRLPGTFNNRSPDERIPVRVLSNTERRYEPQDFIDRMPADFQMAPAKSKENGAAGKTTVGAAQLGLLALDQDARPPASKMLALMENDKRFSRSWNHDRSDLSDQSASGYDMSVATIAAEAGWTDQEVTNLMIARRRKHGDDLKLRENYYAKTIGRARTPLMKAGAEEQLNDALDDAPTDQADVLRDSLSTIFGVDISKISKFQGDPPIYYMNTKQGDITIGKIGNIISQEKFRGQVAAATGIMITAVRKSGWDRRVQAILNACEEIGVGDASHPGNETQAWLDEYLGEKPPKPEDEIENAAALKEPFVKNGRVHIFLDNFLPSCQPNYRVLDNPKELDKNIRGDRNVSYACNPMVMRLMANAWARWRFDRKMEPEALAAVIGKLNLRTADPENVIRKDWELIAGGRSQTPRHPARELGKGHDGDTEARWDADERVGRNNHGTRSETKSKKSE